MIEPGAFGCRKSGLLTQSRHFDAGDPLPSLKLEDPQGRMHVPANAVKGKAVVLLVYPSNRFPAT